MFKIICLFAVLSVAIGSEISSSTDPSYVARPLPKLLQAISSSTPRESPTTVLDETVTTVVPEVASSSDIDRAETFGFGYYGYPQYYGGYRTYYRHYPSYSYGYPYYY